MVFGSTLSILNGTHKFTKISHKIIKKKDKRITKYSPNLEQPKDDISSLLGPKSRKTFLSRIKLTNSAQLPHQVLHQVPYQVQQGSGS